MAELNLIPSYMKKKRSQKNRKQNILYVTVIIAAILFLGLYFPHLAVQQLRDREVDLKSQVDAQYSVIEERKMMIDKINKTNELTARVEELQKNRISKYALITGLQKITPSDLIIDNLSYTTELITIAGISKSYNSIAIFAANLQQTDAFKNAVLNSISSSENNFSYNISIKLK